MSPLDVLCMKWGCVRLYNSSKNTAFWCVLDLFFFSLLVLLISWLGLVLRGITFVKELLAATSLFCWGSLFLFDDSNDSLPWVCNFLLFFFRKKNGMGEHRFCHIRWALFIPQVVFSLERGYAAQKLQVPRFFFHTSVTVSPFFHTNLYIFFRLMS